MQKFMIGFVVFLVYCIPARRHYVCEIRNLCEDNQSKESVATNATNEVAEIPDRTKDLSLKSGDLTILADYDQFGFLPNSAELQLTDNNKEYLAGIAKYLEENPESRLEIIGYYFPDEKLDSKLIFDNLGVARAAAIQSYLVSEHKIEEDRFRLKHEIVERGENQKFLDIPIAYNIITSKDSPTARGEEVLEEASYTFTRMTFSDINFESNSDKFTPSQNFITYADSVKRYLELNPSKSLTIIGHTDSDANDDYNYGLGLSRANNVIVFLRDETGIELKKIDAESKGEKKPIAPNDTDSNKRKNRRVEVIIN
ncbi:MAG: OmpA family protein [Saprospiraceae bacterium]